MKKRDNKKILLILLLLIIGISIGYAALATTLNINGNTTIEKASWDIHFENLVKTTGSETATTEAAIDGTKTLIEYTVTLNEPGDFYEFTVDIVNNGTIDAMISEVLKEGLTTDQEKYIEYTTTYLDGVPLEEKDYLKSNDKENISVRVKYRDDISAEDLPTEETTLNLRFQVTYIQADETAKEKKFIGIIKQEESGKLLPGDELAISTEHFYVVSSDENETIMLAKYNLLVGEVYNSELSSITKTYTEEDAGYGMQNKSAKGYVPELNERIGVVSFSSTNYWMGKIGDDLTYPGKYGFPNYPYVYDSNSNLYNYVELYKTELEKLNANVITARLLTAQEAIELGCVVKPTNMCPVGKESNGFISETSYWIGSPQTDENVFRIFSDGRFNNHPYSYVGTNGVRPVIVVNTSDILS